MENMEEISQIVAKEIGRSKHKVSSNSLVQRMFGKKYKDLTLEEKKEYDAARYKQEKSEAKLAAKREYERERYKAKKEEILAKAKERYAAKCMASQKEE